MRVIIIILMTQLFLSGCVAKPKPTHSVLIGSCKQTLEEYSIWETFNNIYVGSFILSSSEQPQLSIGKLMYGKIPSGTQLRVSQILQGANGSYGPFFRVQVEILSGQFEGLVADIPACVPYHPNPKWVNSCTVDPNEFIFNNEMLTDCSI